MITIDLKDKIALVTGVSGGIGAGVARVLAQAGCHIACCSRTEELAESIQSLKNSVEKEGCRFFYRQTDITVEEQVNQFVMESANQFGRIDIAVSNAGVNIFRGVENCSGEDWIYNQKLNLESHWHLARTAKPWLEKSGKGVIVIMTSNHAFTTIKGCFPYNVTKTALTGLVRAMAIDWGPNIRVVGMAPGFIDTPGNDKWFNSFPDPVAERERTINLHPAGKLGTPEEVGAWCAFLASGYAAFATGTTYLLDGGRSAIMQDN